MLFGGFNHVQSNFSTGSVFTSELATAVVKTNPVAYRPHKAPMLGVLVSTYS